MKIFGTEEYGDREGFKVICRRCLREADLVPAHHYKTGDYKNPEKITLELRCRCGNRYGATIHSENNFM